MLFRSRPEDELELLGVAAGRLGGADVGLGDDLEERRPGAIEVDEADPAPVGGRAGGVDELGGVLLEVGAPDPERKLNCGGRSERPRVRSSSTRVAVRVRICTEPSQSSTSLD